MLLGEIISYLNSHIAVDHETMTHVCDLQISQSSNKSFLPSNMQIDLQFLELLCDVIHRNIFAHFKGLSLNTFIEHDYVSNTNVPMLIAPLYHVEPAYKTFSHMKNKLRRILHNRIPRQAWNTDSISAFGLAAGTSEWPA